MKIYTKQGDKGSTKLGSGAVAKKYDPIVEALGSIDELNSVLGFAISKYANDDEYASLNELNMVQSALFSIGAEICMSKHKYEKIQDGINYIEREIDRLEKILPPLKNFIMPGGSEASAWLHFCRNVCRRAERRVVEIVHEGLFSNHEIITYLNRLSDYLFCLARYMNEEIGDEIWKPQ